MSETKFEDLKISNDFMFKEVMKSNKGLCKRLVGSIMQQDIEDIVYIETEKTLQPYYDSRGIRLDVILADDNHTRYNLEMQARNVISKAGVALLPKRTRYYQSVIDMDMLKKGENFDQLNPLVLIFICTFDFYKEGRYVYTFKSRCLENLELELANDVTVKLVNAKGKHGQVNTLLKNFLRYVMTNEPVDDFTEDVERQVWAVKNDIKRVIAQNGQDFNDGSHIIYVNGEKRYDKNALSMLMHDFFCKDAKDIKNAVLADRVRHFKEEESGVEEMCEIMQKLANDAAYENSVKIAKKLLRAGASIDLVVQGTELPREEVEAIAKRLGKLIA